MTVVANEKLTSLLTNKMSQYEKHTSSIGTIILSRLYPEGNNHHTFSKHNVYSICKQDSQNCWYFYNIDHVRKNIISSILTLGNNILNIHIQ